MNNLYESLPDRHDMGNEENYTPARAIRGLLIALALSIPMWGLIITAVIFVRARW